jgi:hypothetical protein
MKTNKIIGIVGTGMFFYLTLTGISFLSSKIIEELLMFSNLSPILISGISEYVTLVIVLMTFTFAIRKIRNLNFDTTSLIKKIFLISVLTYVLTQLLGFALPFISNLYQTAEYFDLKAIYVNELNENYLLREFAIQTPSFIIKYVIIVFVILREIKKE